MAHGRVRAVTYQDVMLCKNESPSLADAATHHQNPLKVSIPPRNTRRLMADWHTEGDSGRMYPRRMPIVPPPGPPTYILMALYLTAPFYTLTALIHLINLSD